MSQASDSSAPFAPDDPVLKLAIAMFERDGWIDARLLAKEAGIGRATLYRRYGDRDRILGEVVWALFHDIAADQWEKFHDRGAEGIAEMIGRSQHAGAEIPAMRKFVTEHTETALRVMTSGRGVVQPRTIESLIRLITTEIGEPSDIEVGKLAYAVARVGESFYHRELITGEPTDFESTTIVIKRLLNYQPINPPTAAE